MSGCHYRYPFSNEKIIPIDSRLIGKWEMIADKNWKGPVKIDKERESFTIKKINDYEVFIRFPAWDIIIDLKAHIVQVDNVKFIQIKHINPMSRKAGKYDFLQFKISEDIGKVSYMNRDLIKRSQNKIPDGFIKPKPWSKSFDDNQKESSNIIQSSEERLRHLIIENIHNPELFIKIDEVKFKKIK